MIGIALVSYRKVLALYFDHIITITFLLRLIGPARVTCDIAVDKKKLPRHHHH
jgi:hypothetical protein